MSPPDPAEPPSLTVLCVDDTPGSAQEVASTLERGEETPFEHGSGLSLWAVHWLVTHLRGSLSICEREPRGTRIEIELPGADG